MKTYIPFVLFCFLISFSATLPAAEADSTATKPAAALLAYPYAFYTPETGVAGGAGGLYSFYSGTMDENRPSQIKTALTFTQKSQVLFVVWPEFYFRDGKYFLEILFNYFKFPDRFYGIGNSNHYRNRSYENYTPQIYRLFLNGQTQLFPGFYAGIKYQLESQKILSIEPAQGTPPRVLETAHLPGREGYTVSGAGFILKFDNRDNINYPARGNFSQFTWLEFTGSIGSKYNYSSYTLDIRQYLPLGRHHIVAVQGLVEDRRGRLPFQSLAAMGGQWNMRGYYFGRYRDRSMAVLSGEYRMPLYRRIRAHLFAATGAVAPALDRLSSANLRVSMGIGFRYLYDAAKRIYIRMDIAFLGGEFGPYLNVVEAY